MYSEETVFVIGAGASWHYGYPTGAALIDQMISWANLLSKENLGNTIAATVPSPPSFHQWQINWLRLFQDVEGLRQKLIASNPLVIDYFLGHNPDLHVAGKFLIALAILECEFHSDRSNANYKYRNINRALSDKPASFRDNDDWYRYIVEQLTRDCRDSPDLTRNPVRFITFNYDMSLEDQLYRRLSGMTRFAKNDVSGFLDNGRIIHVYGKIGSGIGMRTPEKAIFGPLGNNRPLDATDPALHAFLVAAIGAAASIQTIDPIDKELNADALTSARTSIAEAKTICFLGYGFDDNNNRRLNIKHGLRNPIDSRRRLYFSNMDDHDRVNRRVSSLLFQTPYRLERGTAHAENNFPGDLTPIFAEKSTRDTYGALAYDFEFPSTER
jgi:hypothetical protein